MLHLFCGKIAAGKSTLAAQIAAAEGGILISEDAWLSALFADHLKTGQDYKDYSGRLRQVMAPHIIALLERGMIVVLDFQANTQDVRRWMKGILAASGTAHKLHVLDPPDAVCLTRLRARNAASAHAFTVTEDQFHAFSKYFDPPTEAEGFTLIRYTDEPPVIID